MILVFVVSFMHCISQLYHIVSYWCLLFHSYTVSLSCIILYDTCVSYCMILVFVVSFMHCISQLYYIVSYFIILVFVVSAAETNSRDWDSMASGSHVRCLWTFQEEIKMITSCLQSCLEISVLWCRACFFLLSKSTAATHRSHCNVPPTMSIE